MSSSRILGASHAVISNQHAREARARAWAYVFDCYRKKEAARPGGPDDGTKSKEDSASEHIIR